MSLAFDAATVNTSSSARNSASFAHTCSGSDRGLVVILSFERYNQDPDCDSITYNGVSLTRRVNVDFNLGGVYFRHQIWTLENPASGSNTVVVTYDGNVNPDAICVLSYTGVRQAGMTGATQSATGNGNNPTLSITTLYSNSLVVGGCAVQGGDSDPFSPGAGQTERTDGDTGTSADLDFGYSDSDEPASSPGAVTHDYTASVSDYWIIAAIEVREEAVSSSSSYPGVGIDAEYQESSQHEPQIQCQACGAWHWLTWELTRGPTAHDPHARLICPSCTADLRRERMWQSSRALATLVCSPSTGCSSPMPG